MCNQTWNYGAWLLQSPNLDQGLHQSMWWESCSTGRACFRLLLHEKATGPFSTTHEVNVQPNLRQRLQSSSERQEREECGRKCVLEASMSSSLERYKRKHTPWMCNPSKELHPSRGAAGLLCPRAVIQCLRGVLDLLHMWKLIAHPTCVWLLTEEGYTQIISSTQKS